MRIGDDWPGVFIRGDEALGMAASLKRMAEAYNVPCGQGSLIHEWIETLNACKVDSH